MDLNALFDHFADQSPLPVMARVSLEHALPSDLLDSIFREHASKQYEGELLFSQVVRLMLPVSCGIRPSVNAAFHRLDHSIDVSLASVYYKLQGIEVEVTRELVRQTAARLAEVAKHLRADLPVPFPGYANRILDGSHLEASHHRIRETRDQSAAPLPGVGLAVLDPARRMIIDYFPCEDAHAQERSILPKLIDDLEPGQVWIADRNFCVAGFLWELHANRSYFVIRKHAANVRYEATGPEKPAGSTETGEVFEQPVKILDDFGGSFPARLIRLVLKEKTRDGDREILLLTNLGPDVSAVQIADGYRQRWTIETAFGEIRRCLQGEINALGYPKAALFSFGMALLAFNVMNVIATAMRAAHGEAMQQEFSTQQAAEEIHVMWSGMHVLLPAEYWVERIADLTPRRVAAELIRLAKNVNVKRFRKAPRRARSPAPKRKHNPKKPHVATARLIKARK